MNARMMAGILRRVLPANNSGDAIYAWLHYLVTQGRTPGARDSGRLNDYLYSMKIDGTLLDPMLQFVTDKVYGKVFVSAMVGEQYVMKSLQVLNTAEEVERLRLTQFPCVIKPSHLSGVAQFCPESDENLNREEVKHWLRRNYYREHREQNYRYLTPRVLVEEFFSVDGHSIPDDYKLFCFAGAPRFIQVDSGRFTRHTRNLYDTSWRRLPWSLIYPGSDAETPRPDNLEEMLDVAARLSAPFSLVRVDMYTNGREVRVGELTPCPESAGGRIRPTSGEYALGRLLFESVRDLPETDA